MIKIALREKESPIVYNNCPSSGISEREIDKSSEFRETGDDIERIRNLACCQCAKLPA
jgi:hypothetical protein